MPGMMQMLCVFLGHFGGGKKRKVKEPDQAEKARLLGCLRAFLRVGRGAANEHKLKSLFLGLISEKSQSFQNIVSLKEKQQRRIDTTEGAALNGTSQVL